MLVFFVSSWPDAQCDLRLFADRNETFQSDAGHQANIQVIDKLLMGKPNGWGSLLGKCQTNFRMVVFVKDTDETLMLKSRNFSESFVLHLSESAPGHAGADEGYGSNEETGLLTFDQFPQNSQFVKRDELL